VADVVLVPPRKRAHEPLLLTHRARPKSQPRRTTMRSSVPPPPPTHYHSEGDPRAQSPECGARATAAEDQPGATGRFHACTARPRAICWLRALSLAYRTIASHALIKRRKIPAATSQTPPTPRTSPFHE